MFPGKVWDTLMMYIPKRYTITKRTRCNTDRNIVRNKEGKQLSVQRYENALQNTADGKLLLKDILMLKHMQFEGIENIVDIYFCDIDSFDIYVVTPALDTDLENIILSKQTLTPEHWTYISALILRAIKFAHSAGGFPGFVEPRKVAIRQDCETMLTHTTIPKLERFHYRPPEVLVFSLQFQTAYSSGPAARIIKTTNASDMWAAGLLLLQLVTRKKYFEIPLKEPQEEGNPSERLLRDIVAMLGHPTEEDLRDAGATEENISKFRSLLSHVPTAPTLEESLTGVPSNCIDLISKLLVFSPKKRLSAAEALTHPFFELLLLTDEDCPTCNKGTFSWQEPADEIKGLIWEEIKNVRIAELRN